jgi:hypothetical protein
MPTSWGPKRERQYRHIKESEMHRGASPRRAKEIAARTVNKKRRESGETPSVRTQGTGNPTTPLEARSADELYNIAREMRIAGRSRMTKVQLIREIRAGR